MPVFQRLCLYTSAGFLQNAEGICVAPLTAKGIEVPGIDIPQLHDQVSLHGLRGRIHQESINEIRCLLEKRVRGRCLTHSLEELGFACKKPGR